MREYTGESIHQPNSLREKWWFESAVFTLKLSDRDPTELKFYPIALGDPKQASPLGRPILADAKQSKKIADRMKQMSEPFKTEIEYDKDVGTVAL